MALRRPYCLRGYRKGYIYCLGVHSGEDSYRKINDPKYKDLGLYDGTINHCFIKKNDDIKEGREPCFDEGRMWCIPNNCSVFDAKQLYWKKKKESYKRDIDILRESSSKIIKIIDKISNECNSFDDLLSHVDDLVNLEEILSVSTSIRQYHVDRLFEEGEL